MDLGQNVMLLRKKLKISQSQLGKLIGTSGDVIGRYERGDIKPSIDVVSKIADALHVSVDYLIGKTNIKLDESLFKRIEDISRLPHEKQEYIYNFMDLVIRDYQAQKAYIH